VLRAALLSALVLGLLVLTGCWPAGQSQPPTSTAPAASGAAADPKPTSGAAMASRGANATTTAKPTAVVAKPAASPAGQAVPSPVASANGGASVKPTAQPSPPAVVATSVAGLPAVGASPVAGGESRGAAPADALGVAASAGSAAAANVSDSEATTLCGPGAILSTRAGQAVGRQATVAIARVEASYQPNIRGQPTFLNDAPFPNHVFTAVIWGSDRRQFQPPPEGWQGKSLCVTGPVELFQQRPQIVVSSPSQLRAAR
jgi:hypothetical protein